jgi:hypothetical protein
LCTENSVLQGEVAICVLRIESYREK